MSEALLALVVALAACVQATAGMGFALILSPVVLVVLAPTTAMALITGGGRGLRRSVHRDRRERPAACDVAGKPPAPASRQFAALVRSAISRCSTSRSRAGMRGRVVDSSAMR